MLYELSEYVQICLSSKFVQAHTALSVIFEFRIQMFMFYAATGKSPRLQSVIASTTRW